MGLSIWELLIILVIVAILFGTKKLRSIGGDLGNAVKGFRSAIKDDDDNADSRNENQQNANRNVIDSESATEDRSDENSGSRQ